MIADSSGAGIDQVRQAKYVLTVFICRFIKKHMQAHTFEANTMKACMPICMTFNI